MDILHGELPILIVAPLGRDALLIQEVLEKHGYSTRSYRSLEELSEALDEGTGAILITEEALIGAPSESFHLSLAHQPPWSDVPVLFLSRAGGRGILLAEVEELAKSTGNLTLLERPLRTATLTSVVKVAMRSRKRQLQIRELLIEREEAREKLEELNQLKDRFLAALSHELRTPLTPALMATSVLDQLPELGSDARREVETIRNSIKIQTRLVDELLDLSRIIHGKLFIARETIDLHALLDQCIVAARRMEKATKGMELHLQLGAPQYFVSGDRSRLSQVFMNLLTNAVKFTPETGIIRIESENPAPGTIAINVSDTGIGLSEEQAATIFQSFEQGGEQITRCYGGLGLGLAISKGLVEAHEGEIRVKSDGLGKGSTFCVCLPVSVPPPSQAPVQTEDANDWGAPLRILVVEDHRETAEVLTRLLTRAGHHALSAHSRAEAETVAKNEPIDFVLSDLGLPDGSGHDLMRSLNRQYGLRGIALSGFGTNYDQQLSKESGFVAHLTKPVSWEALRSKISAHAQIDGSERLET